jgi:hypothetical protein
MLVWFESDAFVEYARLIGGARFFGIDEYEKFSETKVLMNYQDFLLERKNSFFVRLITCPLCFSFWATWITVIAASDALILFPICNILSLLIYKITSKVLSL